MKRYLPILVIIAAMVIFFAAGLHKYLSFQVLAERQEWLTAYVAEHFVIASVVFILMYMAVTGLSIPGAAVASITGGFLFGTWVGGFWIVIGATGGASLLFLAVKTAFGETLREKAGPWIQKVREGFENDAFSYLLFLRMAPAFPFFVVNIVPALLNVKFRTYVVATVLGILPGCFVFASIGSGIGSIFESGEVPTLKTLITWQILGPLAGLAVLALVPIVIKKFKKS